jgi:uncharacterized protein DUF481
MTLKYLLILSLLITPVITFDVIAEDEATASTLKEEDKTVWSPSATEYDWVQLISGEWLKGEIKSMYNESLEFDSEKLKLLTISFDDVKNLKSFRSARVNIENQGTVRGKLHIIDNRVIIGEGEHKKEFERIELISFTPGGKSEIDLWSIKFTLGLDLKSGNTEQFDFSSKLSAKRRTAKSRFVTEYIGNISKTNAVNNELEETVNNHRINTKMDVYVTRYFFYSPVFAEYFEDAFLNIEKRYTLGVGIGYTLIDSDRTDWRISGGPSYLSTKYVSVQPGEEQQVSAGSLALGTVYEIELNNSIDFIFRYDIQLSEAESGGYTHFIVSTFKTEITGKLDFDISFYWDRISKPIVDENGVRPEKDDYRLVLGVTYSY